MFRSFAYLVVLAVLAPTALAQAPNGLPDAAAPETPAWQEALADVGDAVATGASATASAASAVGSGIGAAASAVGAAIVATFAAIGHGLSLAGAGIAAAAKAIGAALATLGGLVADGALAAASAIATGATLIASAITTLFSAGAATAREHPKETAIAAGSVASAGTLGWLVRRFGALAFIPLYSRLASSEMLDNSVRAKVYAQIQQQPGIHPSAIMTTLGLGWGTVVYHLARLEQSKLVSVKQGARKCYFAVGADLDTHERAAVAAVTSDKARDIVDAIRATPGITQKDLAGHLGISQALASWHVKRLVVAGVLCASRVGRSNTLTVAAHVPAAAPAMTSAAAVPA